MGTSNPRNPERGPVQRLAEQAVESQPSNGIRVSNINIEWFLKNGRCTFEKLPIIMMWVDTSLAGLFSGVQAMVGTPRYLLALQSEGRKSVEQDWQVMSQFPDFHDGFKAIANIAAVAGWGEWDLVSLDREKKECCFRIKNTWEGNYQKAIGECWGSGFLAGKMSGYCTKLFETNCWADQTSFIARGDAYDEFVVKPSNRSIEKEIDSLLAADEATRADMAVALKKLEQEIAERKRAEEKLKESEKRYRAIFEGAAEGILITRLDTQRFLYANPAICGMFGYTQEEITALSVADLHSPEHLDRIQNEFSAQAQGIRKLAPGLPCMRKDKTIFYADVVTGKIVIDGIECNLGFFTDVTERKRAEEALQKSQKLESLGVLAGGIAHDFNNLLVGIFANIDMARSHAKIDKEVKEYLNEAIKVFSRTKDLTRQLLTFAKGGKPVQKTGALGSLLTETVHFTLSGSHVSCRFDIADDLWLCNFDENQIAQVIQNIILNAQEAMPMGGTISIQARNAILNPGEFPSVGQGRFVIVSIQDTGVGIPKEILPRIFDPFFTTKQKGSGLGLATAYSIISKHEGYIDVASEVSKGTTFKILLPASSGDSLLREGMLNGAHRGTGKILIMDDEDFIRDVLSKMLEAMGYTVASASNGKEALQMFFEARDSSQPFKAAIFDLTVPGGMGGKEAIAELRRKDSSTVVIVSSGYSEDPVMSNPSAFGFTDSISKPYKESDVAASFNRLFSQSQ